MVKEEYKFRGICLKQESVSFIHGNVLIVLIHDELDKWSRDLNRAFTLSN